MIKLLNILKENILVETEVDSLDEKWSQKYKKSIGDMYNNLYFNSRQKKRPYMIKKMV